MQKNSNVSWRGVPSCCPIGKFRCRYRFSSVLIFIFGKNISEMETSINEYFSRRRTVRRYSAKPVDAALVRNLLALAAHAPNTGNMQLYSAVVTSSPEMKRLLAPAHFNQPQVEGAAHVVTFCADYRRYSLWCEESGTDPGCDNFQSFMAAVIDTCLFAQQFNTLAEMNGLGCCYLGTTTYNAEEIGQLRMVRRRNQTAFLPTRLLWMRNTGIFQGRI